MWDPYAEFESIILPNGLTIYATNWPGRSWESVGFLIHSGAEHDPIGLEGVAHFVEHVVSDNGAISQSDMEEFFNNSGGSVNFGITSYLDTQYSFLVPAEKTMLAQALVSFGSMLLSAKLEKFIERERQVILEEFRRNYPVNFKFILEQQKRSMLYAGYWLERYVQVLGAPDSIEKITRGDLQSFYDQHYTPSNISVVCVGGMKLSELVNVFSQSPFSINKKGSRTLLPDPVTNFIPLLESRRVFRISEYAAVSSPLDFLAYQSSAKIPGNVNPYSVSILCSMLDETLYKEVRENRAWTYSIYSSAYNLRHFHEISIHCDSLALGALDKIEEVVERCIVSVKNLDDLFERVRRNAIARKLMIDQTGADVRDSALNDLLYYHRIITLKEEVSNIEKVAMKDIQSILQWLRPEYRWTLIQRP